MLMRNARKPMPFTTASEEGWTPGGIYYLKDAPAEADEKS